MNATPHVLRPHLMESELSRRVFVSNLLQVVTIVTETVLGAGLDLRRFVRAIGGRMRLHGAFGSYFGDKTALVFRR
jgi:hypothetical protein